MFLGTQGLTVCWWRPQYRRLCVVSGQWCRVAVSLLKRTDIHWANVYRLIKMFPRRTEVPEMYNWIRKWQILDYWSGVLQCSFPVKRASAMLERSMALGFENKQQWDRLHKRKPWQDKWARTTIGRKDESSYAFRVKAPKPSRLRDKLRSEPENKPRIWAYNFFEHTRMLCVSFQTNPVTMASSCTVQRI